jgi:hypothetical protein
MSRHGCPVNYHVVLTMPYEPGTWETDVSAFSAQTAILRAGQAAEREGIMLTADVHVVSCERAS